MLSYQAIGAEHDMQAEPGCEIERLSGTRAATTFRKLPSARPGAKASAASVSSIPSLSARPRRMLSAAAARGRQPRSGDSSFGGCGGSIGVPLGTCVMSGNEISFDCPIWTSSCETCGPCVDVNVVDLTAQVP